jgi:hypothetical protein
MMIREMSKSHRLVIQSRITHRSAAISKTNKSRRNALISHSFEARCSGAAGMRVMTRRNKAEEKRERIGLTDELPVYNRKGLRG